MRLRIKNWETFQHYKNRCPPWIKLHFKILSSRDWVNLNDADRVLAIASMLIASQDDANDGSFDADPDYFYRVAYLKTRPNFNNLIKQGFLEVLLADASVCKRMPTNAIPEKETETEIEKKLLSEKKPSDDFSMFWKAYPKKTGKDAALKLWNKLQPPIADVLKALAWQRASKQWQDGFIPLPATYLNQGRWKDEPEVRTGGGAATVYVTPPLIKHNPAKVAEKMQEVKRMFANEK